MVENRIDHAYFYLESTESSRSREARLARLARYLAMTVVIFLFAVVLAVHGQGEDYRQGIRTRFDLVHQSNSARGGR